MDELLHPLDLKYVPIRHYDSGGALFLDSGTMPDKSEHPFADNPEIVLLRSDSLIFDIVQKRP